MIKITNKTKPEGSVALQQAKSGLSRLLKRNDVGFFKLPERDDQWTRSRDEAQRAHAFASHLGVLGIGGSSLGGRALMQALRCRGVDFFENVDGVDFWKRLESLSDIQRTHWAIISKSGNTIETLAQANALAQFLKKSGLELSERATVVSERKDNPLTKWANQNAVPVLEIPVDVGGRFSVLSSVGLFPAAFAGINLEDLRAGAKWALTQEGLVESLVAQSLESFSRGEFVTMFWPYCNGLRDLGLWIQQLWAESLAKKTKTSGSAAPDVSCPVPLIGANDQHSVLQQIAEGRRDKFVWFFKVAESETFGPEISKNLFPGLEILAGKKLGDLLSAEQKATERALLEGGVQSLTLSIEKLDARTMGALFMIFELVVGALGEALEINAFDQPGVELGKRLAKEILSR